MRSNHDVAIPSSKVFNCCGPPGALGPCVVFLFIPGPVGLTVFGRWGGAEVLPNVHMLIPVPITFSNVDQMSIVLAGLDTKHIMDMEGSGYNLGFFLSLMLLRTIVRSFFCS